MSSLLVVLTSLGFISGSIFAVAQLYDGRYRRWAHTGGGVGLAADTMWLIQQAVPAGFRAMMTVPDWVGVVIWGAVTASVWFVRAKKWDPMVAFLYPIVSVLWLMAQAAPKRAPIAVQAMSAQAVGLWTAVSLSTVFFLLAVVFGIMYLEKERELKHKRARLFYYQLPALGELDGWTGRLVVAGWLLYTPFWAVVLVFSHGISSAVWCTRTRQVAAMLVWVAYGLVVAARTLGRGDGHRVAQGAMWAFLSVLMNVWGIDLICVGSQRAIL